MLIPESVIDQFIDDYCIVTIPTYTAEFRTASRGDNLQLASILVHELAHHRGGDEETAFNAELRFLHSQHAPPEVMAWAEEAKAHTCGTNPDNEETRMAFPNPVCPCHACNTHFNALKAAQKGEEHIARLTAEVASLKRLEYAPPDAWAAGIRALQEATK